MRPRWEEEGEEEEEEQEQEEEEEEAVWPTTRGQRWALGAAWRAAPAAVRRAQVGAASEAPAGAGHAGRSSHPPRPRGRRT